MNVCFLFVGGVCLCLPVCVSVFVFCVMIR